MRVRDTVWESVYSEKEKTKNSGEAQENDDGEKNITAVQKAKAFLSLNGSSAMLLAHAAVWRHT